MFIYDTFGKHIGHSIGISCWSHTRTTTWMNADCGITDACMSACDYSTTGSVGLPTGPQCGPVGMCPCKNDKPDLLGMSHTVLFV